MFSRRRSRPVTRFAPSVSLLDSRVTPSGGILDPIGLPEYDPNNGFAIDCSPAPDMLRIAYVEPAPEISG